MADLADINDILADLASRLPDWPHEALLLVAGLQRGAAHFRKMADTIDADAARATAQQKHFGAKFAKGQASGFRIAAEAVERELEWAGAQDRVRDMLAAAVAETAP